MGLDSAQSSTDQEFLQLLAARQILLRVQDGKLRISAPAGAIDDRLKAELVRRKAMLLAATEQSSEGTPRAEALPPLSYAQERLWLIERFHPGNYAYNIPESSEIRAAIDPALFQRAIDFVVARYESLRTDILEDTHGYARQRIYAELAVPLTVFDYRHLASDEQETRLQQTMRAWAREPFDLTRAPLVRFYLVQLGEAQSVVFINIHHIVSDRWSMRILYRELLAAYTAYAAGHEPALAPLAMQYPAYARRERAAAGRESEDQLAYWLKQLSTLSEPMELPFLRTSHSNPGRENPFDGAIHLLDLTEADTVAIRGLARAHSASPYMVLLAGYAALLYRFTGSTDICIGSPVSSRTTMDTEGLIGLFVNTLAIRSAVADRMRFDQLLHSVRETVLDAQANSQVPLQRVLAELQLREGRAIPLFQTMLAFDPLAAVDNTEGAAQVLLDPGIAKFDLTLQLIESRQRIYGWFEYRTDLFASASIARLAQGFSLLLRNALREPATPVGQFQILSQEERHRLLHTWNATAFDFPRDRTIHALFEQQVEATPDAIALIDGIARLSYAELNRMANGIAHGLLARSLPPEARIGVHLERTAVMIAAMLGILKAGAAYVPLDPAYPAERVAYMIEDSGCSAVFSDTWEESENVLNPRSFAAMPESNPNCAATPVSLAYVIYTSGSTGRPKGVAIEHHSTVSFLAWGRSSFPPAILRGTLAATSISFDLSVFEIFLPLISGATIILAADILALNSLPSAPEVTLVNTVPSAAAALLDTRAIPPTLRTINLAGEPLSSHLVDRLYRETSIAQVNDLYGPTETTTYSTWTRRTHNAPATIGRPLANTRIYLVDQALQLVPEGLPGELLIAGEGVARGYLNRPELTAEKFVSLLHLGEPGRAYRTGDLGRYHQDGTLVYEGRIDQQVKLRGYRIEIGEVEAALLSHPSVLEAAVTVHAGSLAAVLRMSDSSANWELLIEHQARTLPGYMVARTLVAVEQLPRTANGKIDRKGLSALIAGHRSEESPQSLIADPLEGELVSIWQEGFATAGLAQAIGIDDDFFQIGGHSLLALRLFAEIESRLGIRMMLSVLFEAPTIRLLAAYMRREKLV